MKKSITLALLLCFVVTCALAQSPYGNIDDKNDAFIKSRQERVINKNVRFTDKVVTPTARFMANAPEELDPALFEQPEGLLLLMRRSGTDYLPVWGSPSPANYTEKGTYVVVGADGNYYFKNFVTNMCNGGTWIKGEFDGSVITVKMGQICAQLWYDNGVTNELYTYYLCALSEQEATGIDWYGNEYTYTEYVPDMDVEEIKFDVNDDGTITSQNPDVLYGGIIEEADGSFTWPGYGDMNCTFYPFDEEPQTAPEDVEFSEYVMSNYPYLSEIDYKMIQGGILDNVFYVKGLADIVPDAVIMATIEGDKARIATNQFLGLDKTYSTLAYLKPCDVYIEYDEWGWGTIFVEEIEEMVLDYDATGNRFSNESNGLLINAGKETVSTHEQYHYPTFYLFTDKPAVPASPVFTSFMPYTETEYYAQGYAGFDIFTNDVDGNYIVPEKLFYTCYLDDAPMVFSMNDYPDLEEDMTVIPYAYSNYDIISGGKTHYIYFYSGDFDRFGVQTIYRGGGEERRSPIIYYNDGTNSGINEAASDATVISTTYFDMMGRQHNGLNKGVNIVVVKYSDGTVKSAKVMLK